MTLPIWLAIVIGIALIFLGFVVGVIRCYSSTPRIGNIILTPDDESGEVYLFLELDKPLPEMAPSLKDGKEVLATIRAKNRS
jgi:hypothetical protein